MRVERKDGLVGPDPLPNAKGLALRETAEVNRSETEWDVTLTTLQVCFVEFFFTNYRYITIENYTQMMPGVRCYISGVWAIYYCILY